MNMTSLDILENILKHYDSRQEWQKEIAERFHVSQSDISRLLQECGYHNGKFTDGISVDINTAWQNPKVKEICEKIRKAQS